MRVTGFLTAALASAWIVAGAASGAAAMGSAKPGNNDADFTSAQEAVDAGRYADAIEHLKQAVAKRDDNADYYNLLGFASRKIGDFENAFAYYEKALSLEPDHKAAHEYIGEAYLETGKLAEAESHLARLDKICTFGCAEYTELKERIAAYKATH
ncbi:tetratricopeptide repeat protein [Oceanibacterium hippocampi]|uniref:Rhomboid protease GluP n=1 Tax=Oceanibacterium hippocampi TaxID=745714 RepID=A0A1Y5SSB2_9PROT|nr:tetratricopeptide repeat protein [Oceanibacterium hippocampi]SLN46884.1 Rhomboid protease GluP [Oceanibacterium hippocampi]